jgi:hypothetical protein
MLGFDFLLTAGLLAGLYLQPSPFLLSPISAFRLVPIGYLSFFPPAMLLAWLMRRLKLTGWRAGAIFGLEKVRVAGLQRITWRSCVRVAPQLLTGNADVLATFLILARITDQ